MTLRENIRQKLAEWRPPQNQRTLVALTEPNSDWACALTADQRDAVGCVLWELHLQFKGPLESRRDASVAQWAQRTAEQVTGLLEALKVVEVDVAANRALLRSESPANAGAKVSYYEIMLEGVQRATLRRYDAAKASLQKREQVPFTLTHDAISKVVSDLAGVA